MVFAVQGSKDRSEIEMTLELRTLWFEDLKKNDPQTSKDILSTENSQINLYHYKMHFIFKPVKFKVNLC